jgi:hypothetical protein
MDLCENSCRLGRATIQATVLAGGWSSRVTAAVTDPAQCHHGSLAY